MKKRGWIKNIEEFQNEYIMILKINMTEGNTSREFI